MKRLTVFALALAMLALASACSAGDNANHSNSNAANANRANANAANANANAANANTANANRGDWNANISEADYERRKDEFKQKATAAGDTVGSGLKDGWLHVKTRAALAAVDDLEDSNINVDVNDGAIVLRGSLPNKQHVDAAVKAAEGIDGKKSVKNELKVGAAAGNSNNANNANAKGGSH